MTFSAKNENFISIIQNFTEEIKALKFEVERLQEMVASMNHQPAASCDWDNPSGLVTIDEIINVIPGSPAKSTVRRWIREDELPCERLNNRKLLFNKERVLEWLETRKTKSKDEILKSAKLYEITRPKKTSAPWRQCMS